MADFGDKQGSPLDKLKGEVEPWRLWGSSGLMPSYLHDIGNFPRLTPEEEDRWAKQYSFNHAQVRRMIQEHPQVIIDKLAMLQKSDDRKGLATYPVFNAGETAEDGGSEDEMRGDDAFDSVEMDDLREIVDDPAGFLRGVVKDHNVRNPFQKDDEGLRLDMAKTIAPFLRTSGKIHFQLRFFTACVDYFMEGDWHEEGLSPKEQARLKEEMRGYVKAKQEAMNALVEGNLRLVIAVARRFTTSLMSLADMVQEGNIGLMRAVETFEWERGHKLSTYAAYRIRYAITTALNSKGRPIRVPSNILRQLAKIRRVEQEFTMTHDREPDDTELARLVNVSPARLRALKRMGQQPLSLQAIQSNDRGWEGILGDKADPLADRIKEEAVNDALSSALATLRPNEKDILERHFGLNGRPVQSLMAIGEVYGLTSERIRQIESAALQKMRQVFGKNGLHGKN